MKSSAFSNQNLETPATKAELLKTLQRKLCAASWEPLTEADSAGGRLAGSDLVGSELASSELASSEAARPEVPNSEPTGPEPASSTRGIFSPASIDPNSHSPAAGSAGECVRSESHFSTGCANWDRWLPENGLRRGSLIECFSERHGSGAELFALWLARQACQAGGHLVVIDTSGWFYAPAAAAWGIDLQRLVCIRPQRKADALWAFDQSLRSNAIKAVWGHLDHFNDRWFRRFQLAVRASGGIGILLRPRRHEGRPSWADLQFAVRRPQPRQLELRLLRAPSLAASSTRVLKLALQPEQQRLQSAG